MAKMATNGKSRKKPVSQKRVAVVLVALVGTLTASAGLLLALEGPKGGTMAPSQLVALEQQQMSEMITPTVPLRTNAWNYIIIYESGDLAGDADSLADGRMVGGPGATEASMLQSSAVVRGPADFHFVVESPLSRRGNSDGELRVRRPWMEQTLGTPYRGWPNRGYYTNQFYNNSVGVCFIGDVDRSPVSDAQSQTMTQLVTELQRQLHVPNQMVLFQWELPETAPLATPAQKAFAKSFRQNLP